MKTFGKKIFIYIFCGLLTFSLVSSSYYKTVHAFEWVGGALAFEEAIKWGLALLGITATTGMTNAYWEQYGDEFEEYATQNGVTQQEVTQWEMKLCEGILDKGSQVWDRFMEWASSLVGNSSSSSVPAVGCSFEEAVNYVNSLGLNHTWVYNSSFANTKVYSIVLSSYDNQSGFNTYFFTSDTNYTISNQSSTNTTYLYCPNNNSWSSSYGHTYINNSSGIYYWISKNFNCTATSDNWEYLDFGADSSVVGDPNFEGAWSNDIENTGVISSSVPDEADDEVALPMPGVSDSDNTASKDAYDEIIDAINDGTITQEQGIERIQEILKVIVYDTVTDDVLPHQEDPDTGENKKKEDAIQENKDNMGFTLAGLENVFPFCIPFDIYAFMTLLVAEPVAPEFDYPIQSVNGEVEEIHVDLTPFEPVAVVVRYVFDFLFIIGLGIITRSLIGGGSSD